MYVFLLQRLKAAVVQEYKVTKNSQFQRVRDEFQYLHKKLEHIKQLVHDYDDAILTLKNFRSHLQSGGTLIMSLFNPFYEISHEHLDGVWRLEKDEIIEDTNERALCHTCMDLDRCEQIMQVTNRYELLDESGVAKQSEVKTSLIRWYGKYEIKLLLEKAGFSNITTHGDFQDLEYEDGSVALAVKATV